MSCCDCLQTVEPREICSSCNADFCAECMWRRCQDEWVCDECYLPEYDASQKQLLESEKPTKASQNVVYNPVRIKRSQREQTSSPILRQDQNCARQTETRTNADC